MATLIPPMHETQNAVEKPKNVWQIPRYLWILISGFFSRLFYIYSLVWETKPMILVFMMLIAVLNGVLPVAGAYISKLLINALIGSTAEGFNLVAKLMIIQFVYLFAVRLIALADSLIMRISGELVSNNIKQIIMNKALGLDLASFDRAEFYEKLENANREAGMRPIQIVSATFTMMSTIISMISFTAVLWTFGPFVPLVIILAAIPSAIVNYIYKGKNAFFLRHRSTDRRRMEYYSRLMVDKDIVKEVRLFGLGKRFISRYNEVFKKYFSDIKKLIFSESGWTSLTSALMTAVNCGLFLWVAKQVAEGALTVGDYTLYTGALNSISNGVAQLITATAGIYEGTLFIDNMIVFINDKQKIIPSIASARIPERHQSHVIEFRHVFFRYPNMKYDVLKDINLTLHSGESIVLVGLNGAGKTTLLKLLTRLYDPTQGIVLLDGHDIREYDVAQLYNMFGTIFQDFGEYADTVAENIHYGQIDRPLVMDEIRKAAIQANADDFIKNLPKQYDTELMRLFDIDGVELSVGQWQKLAVARAFYNDSDILILDEPTASLDALAEQEIFCQFDQLRKDKMTVFVSHRLSSATTANRIVVLKNGQIIEEGTHTELLSLGGHYYKLFTTQAERYLRTE